MAAVLAAVGAPSASALSLAYARGHEPHRPSRAHRRGTTAIVGIAGFWSTVHVTGRQIRSGQDAKLWDARAAVYIDVLTVLDFLNVRTYEQDQDYEPQ
jgi:hypothetical protein